MNSLITLLRDRYHDWRCARHIRYERAHAPASLNEALDRIISLSTPEDLATFAATTRAQAGVGLHFGPGMAMRNNWGLWEIGTGVSCELAAAGILHDDDKSATIYTALWCRLNGKPFDLAAEAEKHRLYWERHGCYPDGSPISGRTAPTSWRMTRSPDGEWTEEPVDT